MKKNERTPVTCSEVELKWATAKKANKEYQESLLQADVQIAAEFWLQKARLNHEDRGTISNYFLYIKALLNLGILSHTSEIKRIFLVSELNDHYDLIVERINLNDCFTINDRRYRIKALLAFTKFLYEETTGKVKKLIPPPMLTPSADPIPVLARDSLKPQVLTVQEFEKLKEIIKRPKQQDQGSFRDYLVMETMYQTARPLMDILALQKKNIDLSNQCIMFSDISKGHICVPINTLLKNGLEIYLQYSENYRKDETVFITREGNPIFRTHFYQVLKSASINIELGFIATFKMIQWAYVAHCIREGTTVQMIMKELKLNKLPKYLEPRSEINN
jgi:integrase